MKRRETRQVAIAESVHHQLAALAFADGVTIRTTAETIIAAALDADWRRVSAAVTTYLARDNRARTGRRTTRG